MLSLTSSLILASFTLVASAKASADLDKYGPLRAYAQSPVQSTVLTPILRSASAYDGVKEVYGSFTAASVWADTEDYTLDYYHNQVELGGKWQIADRWLMDLTYRWSFSADNHLDGLTKAFHDATGLEQNGREEVSRNRNYQMMEEYNVAETDFEGETLANAVSAYLGYQLYQQGNHAASVGGTLYYNNVGSGPFEGNTFEQALQLNYSYHNKSHAIYTMAGVTFHSGSDDLVGLPSKEVIFSGAAGYRYALNEQHHLYAEYRYLGGRIDDSSDLSDASHESVLGYRFIMKSSAIEFYATENMFNMDNSTDIAFTLGYRHQFN
ncbi:DUF3187 family protein [Vibrio inusitatus]